ncbi:MAG: DNA-processing protein DprA, partial [Alphaproteobacteria bacterium]|nr:DNA-processing protein DprA [Alphaproteobacteria bacterium]
MPKTFTDTEKLAALRLIRSENVGPVTYHQLTSFFNNPSAALEALPSLAKRGGRRKPIKIYSKQAAEKEIAALVKLDGQLLVHGESAYPLALSVINDAPPVLSILGHIHLLKRPMVAIVGARNASVAGLKMTEKLAAGLGERDFLIVSGMARGIDASAHEHALPYGTAAILAGGIDNIYPAENEDLYLRIKEEGVLMAENPLGVKPLARHFPRRNRIIAGLSLGVIVTEAALRSGSLITARLAGEQGREVMAVPGSPLDPRCRGANYLIKNGAALIENV